MDHQKIRTWSPLFSYLLRLFKFNFKCAWFRKAYCFPWWLLGTWLQSIWWLFFSFLLWMSRVFSRGKWSVFIFLINENLFCKHIRSDVKGLFSRYQVAVIQRALSPFQIYHLMEPCSQWSYMRVKPIMFFYELFHAIWMQQLGV
jgi:hypothetical protein